MYQSATANDVSKFDELTFEFTKTYRDQPLAQNSVSGDFVIDVNGLIYKRGKPSGKSASVTVIGGISNFTHEKIPNPTMPYVTVPQKVTICKILRLLAKRTTQATLNSSDGALYGILIGSYYNYIG